MAVYEQDLDRIVIRIVYDGPGRAGKTTNIEQLARLFGGANPDLQLLAADNGHTTHFDWLSFDGGMIDGHHLLIQVVGVPGAKRFEARRAHILRGADAIVLVCDSTPGTAEMARETLDSQREHLGRRAGQVPVVVQANKQDLADALQAHEVGAALGLPYEVPVLGAEATAGIGTRETAVHAIRAAVRLVKRRTARPGIQSIAGTAGTLAALRAALDATIPEPEDIDPTTLVAATPTTTGRKLFRPTTVDEPHVVYVHDASPAVQAAKIRLGDPGDGEPAEPAPPRAGQRPPEAPPHDPAETLPSHPIIVDDAAPESPARAPSRRRRRDTETTEGRVQRSRKERSSQALEQAAPRPGSVPTPAAPPRPGSAPRKIPPRRRSEPGARPTDAPSDTPTLPPADPPSPLAPRPPSDTRPTVGNPPAPSTSLDPRAHPVDPRSYPAAPDVRAPSGTYPAAPALPVVPDIRPPSGSYPIAPPVVPDVRPPSGSYPVPPIITPPGRPPSGSHPVPPIITPPGRPPSGTVTIAGERPPSGSVPIAPPVRAPITAVPQPGERPPSGSHSIPTQPGERPPSGSAPIAAGRPPSSPVPKFRPPPSPQPDPASALDTLPTLRPAPASAPLPVQPRPPLDQRTAVSPTARTLVGFTPQEAALLGLPPLHERGPATPAYLDDDLSPRPAEHDLPPRADLPPGHVWPVPGGRDVLTALAAVSAPRIALAAPDHFTAGPYHVSARRFPDGERALAELRARARLWQPVRSLLPGALALAVEPEHGGSARLWRVVPNLSPLAVHLAAQPATARIRLLEAFARTLGQALGLRARKRICLDLHPDAWAAEQGRVVYMHDELATPRLDDAGPALLAPLEQLADDPVVDVYIDALARELAAFVAYEPDDLGLTAALERTPARAPVAVEARTRLLAALVRR